MMPSGEAKREIRMILPTRFALAVRGHATTRLRKALMPLEPKTALARCGGDFRAHAPSAGHL